MPNKIPRAPPHRNHLTFLPRVRRTIPVTITSMTRTGKIARLPHHLREALNHRLADNIPGRQITAWLNSLPEVQAILRDHFAGDSINQQNLSNWRRGGFLEWHTRQEFLRDLQNFTDSAADLDSALPASLTEHAARLLSFHFAHLLTPSSRTSSPSFLSIGHDPASSCRVKSLCALAHALSTLRRDDFTAARLTLDQTTPAPIPSAEPASPNAVPVAPSPSPTTLLTPAPEPAIKPVKASSSLPSPPSPGSAVPPHGDPLPVPSLVPALTLRPDLRVSPLLSLVSQSPALLPLTLFPGADRRIIPALAKAFG